MQTATNPIGHNKPPSETEILQDRLRDAHSDIISNADTLCSQANEMPPEITTDEVAGSFSDVIKQINGARKSLETARVSEKEPFLAQGRAVDGFFKTVIERLDATNRKLKEPLDAWLRRKEAEERRRRDEEARRLREQQEAERQAALMLQQANMKTEAAAALDVASDTQHRAAKAEMEATARPAELSQTRSSSGAMAQLRTRWVGELVDQKTIDLEKLRHHLNPDHIQSAINSFVRAGGRELAGAKIHEKTETTVR